MKRICCIILALCLLLGTAPPFAGAAVVDSGTCGDNVAWTLEDNGTLTISGTGPMTSYANAFAVPWDDSRDSIATVVVERGVTSISSYAFYACSSLTGVTIPDGVTSIGEAAFQDCGSLTAVALPDSVASLGSYAFYVCGSLASVAIPDGVAQIPMQTFYGCSALASVTIPVSVTSIGDGAFAVCNALRDVYYGGTAAQWSAITIGADNSYLTGATLHYSGETPPDGDTLSGTCGENLTWTLVNGVLTISGTGPMTDYAYSSGGSTAPWQEHGTITTVVMQSGVTSIGDRAFEDCSGLTGVTIPDSVTSIGHHAFFACSGLTGVTIPDSVISIGYAAFASCSGLTGVNVENGNTAYTSENGILFNKDKSILVCYPAGKVETTYVIPDSVTSIGDYAFAYCRGLTGVTIPDSVTEIGNSAFLDCSSLESVVIPVSVSSISFQTFNGGCSALSDVYYGGTRAQWNGVTIDDSDGGNAALYSATIHCTDGDISASVEESADPSYEIVVPVPDRVTDTVYGPEGIQLLSIGPYEEFRDLWVDNEKKIRDVDYEVRPYDIDENNVPRMLDGTVTGTYILGRTITFSEGTHTITLEFEHTDVLGNQMTRRASQLVRVTRPVSDDTDEGAGTYTVTFAANGGAGSMNAVTVTGNTYALPENGFGAPFGQRFRAWRVDGQEYAPGAVVAVSDDLTVTALWEDTGAPVAQGYCGVDGGTNLLWTLGSDWTLTVSGTGSMDSYDEEARAPWYGYHTNIRAAVLETGVASVGSYAFTYCSALEEVSLPETLVEIEDSAFLNCAALEEINLPESLSLLGDRVFYGCESLWEIAVPTNVRDTGDYTFENCAALETVTLPDGLTRVGYYAFYNCGGLEEIEVPSGVTVLDMGAFRECAELSTVALPAGLSEIRDGVFAGCGSLRNVYYAGTVAQFMSIVPRIGAENDELREHPVHCSDGDYDWTPPDPYRILDALQDMYTFQDQTWHLAGALSEFQEFTIDDVRLTRRDVLERDGLSYTASEGSTRLEIPAETFQHFDEGSHTAEADFDNGTNQRTVSQIYTVFPQPGTARIDLTEMRGVTGVEKVSYNGRFQSDPVLEDGLYRFTLVSGEVPPGLTLRDGGYFTGVARVGSAGTYYFTVGLQIKRGGVWPSTYEDTAEIAITIEPGTEVKVEEASDPGYEIVHPVPNQVTETVLPPEQFQLASIGPFEEFRELYIDGDLKIRDVDYDARPCNIDEFGVLHVLEGGLLTGTYIAAKTFTLAQGVHAVSLEFEHRDSLGNKKTHKATQTVTVSGRAPTPTPVNYGGVSSSSPRSTSTSYYSITRANASNGTLTVSPTSAKAGTTVTITATPAGGYHVGTVTVIASNKKSVPVTGGNGSYTFVMPSRRVTIHATFTRTGHTVAVAGAEHGAVSVSTDSQAPGQTVTVSTRPDPGYLLIGVTVRAAGAGTVPVTNVSDNVFSFVMPSGDVTVNAAFTPKLLGSFRDIQGPDWFFDDAEWAYNRGIMRGTSAISWEPQKKINSVTAIVTLERLDGVDLEPYYNGASDGLDNNTWYVAAARWAVTNGIYPANWWVTDELPMNRGEFAVVLYNFLNYRGLDTSAPDSLNFTDAATLTADELRAFRFLQSAQIFQGYEDGAVRSKVHLTRAQLSALLHRLSSYVIRVES